MIPPPLWYAAGLIVAWLLSKRLPIPVTPIAHAAVGWVCVAFGLAFVVPALIVFAKAKTSVAPVRPTTALVTTGPYRYTRNPIYVGLAFAYIGIALLASWLWAFALLPFVIACVHWMSVLREERFLEERFGVEYDEYKDKVPRWL